MLAVERDGLAQAGTASFPCSSAMWQTIGGEAVPAPLMNQACPGRKTDSFSE
jgi:hypothetical protein